MCTVASFFDLLCPSGHGRPIIRWHLWECRGFRLHLQRMSCDSFCCNDTEASLTWEGKVGQQITDSHVSIK